MIAFAWTGASQAGDLYVATGTDDAGFPVNVAIDVVTTMIIDPPNPGAATALQLTISDNSPPQADGTSDIVIACTNPFRDALIMGSGVLDVWTQTFSTDGDTLTLTSPNVKDDIKPGDFAVLNVDFAPTGLGIEAAEGFFRGRGSHRIYGEPRA